jgi:hypothetical protein
MSNCNYCQNPFQWLLVVPKRCLYHHRLLFWTTFKLHPRLCIFFNEEGGLGGRRTYIITLYTLVFDLSCFVYAFVHRMCLLLQMCVYLRRSQNLQESLVEKPLLDFKLRFHSRAYIKADEPIAPQKKLFCNNSGRQRQKAKPHANADADALHMHPSRSKPTTRLSCAPKQRRLFRPAAAEQPTNH